MTVQTLNDMIVEDNETLILSADVDETLPVSFSSTAEITIIDDGGKKKHDFYHRNDFKLVTTQVCSTSCVHLQLHKSVAIILS